VDNLYTELVRNISTGGVFIQTTVPFSVGRQVSLVFPFPTPEEPIRMTGEIVWKSALGVGVRFRSASKRLKEAIASL
jgi:Tfp pilus assembly protein PilZ